MKIKKIEINNFKSIEKLEFDIKKVGNSYTTIFVGINESGKSNILEAFSYFKVPADDNFEFDTLSNQKNETAKYVDFFYHLEFENINTYSDIIKNYIEFDGEFDFEIYDVVKNVYLGCDETEFESGYRFLINLQKKELFFNKKTEDTLEILTENDETNSLKKLTNEEFRKFFEDKIIEIIEAFEPKVSCWTPLDTHLLSDVNLNDWKNDINLNNPLKNIFTLAGFNDNAKILEQVDRITNSQKRSKLVSKLNDALNDYLGKVWKHKIDTVIEITETGLFSLSFKDTGEDNKHDRFSINERSEGAKHFLSLILSLSLESQSNTRKNELILIDEPEIHLHPSGIRDLSKELLKIGEKNYVFVATHSPFLIDRKNKERHCIITKNKKAITVKRALSADENIIDDEVLREAFGLEVFKDLLNPHSLIVEGCSDKIIIQKIFNIIGKKNIGITNGHGSNIDTLASKLNHNDLSILVVVDDDKEGRKYKKNILKIGGAYDESNVFTIRDLVGKSMNNGTIEDLLDIEFLKSQFMRFYKSKFEDVADIIIEAEKPFIEQISIYLKKKKKHSKFNMDLFKKQLSDEFKPTKTSLTKRNPLLNSLAEEIAKKTGA